ncbi:hypothetical protein [Acaryochloris marina]|uniref:Uncharacterized protein n=1 Tax=Acaryochloris marina (strain MBIC 11017) TaxID=329726 RepID=B0C1Y7_ACAM1|nr:hypothetical protein [Acaryochloris marina]ABW27288.1 hypothetical protein AM1_2277 [Acaryochloris marina MBIC11017]BDM82035.1 hypothetical protein AM10699_48990 [Acaryochloris marina MBIC10699]
MSEIESKLLELLSDYVCSSQTSLLQHIFMVNENHKNLRQCIQSITSDKQEISKDEEDHLRELLADFDGFFLDDFGRIFEKAYKYSLVYFQGRSNISPRLTLKVISKDKLATLLKIPESFLSDNNTEISANTGFLEIAQGKDFYLCNNIPNEIANGKYVNIRIKDKAAYIYATTHSVDHSRKFRDRYDQEWVSCWSPVSRVGSKESIESPPETCYKSTLILPVSLATKKLRKEFIEKFQIISSTQRALFGFLCFDHINVEYFKLEDRFFIQILTDILSIYLINQLMFTQFSTVYYNAKKILSD